MSYVKIHRELVHSSVWSQPHHVRVVWITLLALADQDGVVPGSPAGLCRLCAVTRLEFDDAMAVLTADDPDSGSTDHGGKRIVVEHDGGRNVYRIVTYEYYRRLMDADDRKERAAARQARHRAKCDGHIKSRGVTEVTQADTDTDTDHGSPHSPPLGGTATATTEADPDDRITTCPLDLDRKLPPGLLDELADGYHVPRAAVERALSEFVAYWTIGPGTGKRRRNWPKQFRGRCHDLASRGELGSPPASGTRRSGPASDAERRPWAHTADAQHLAECQGRKLPWETEPQEAAS